ncbi:hypothetical protein [Agromyces aerolatus]|uniref:hypothetical protein n=1 Tax=Agromyces sp. LY-1074 TaxID=3074080 RepID=UPI0028643782|nr:MULTISPECIES: hypothetical protein [unclassified Agromyces]MDR5701353.1 hypothetical protein [Agromyces sp. LY-1074]MDR5707611.1 hypothetical protein [Agromyces sp. LY-1358]
MDERAQAGGEISPEQDDDFTVAQDTEFDEAEAVEADEERSIDDGAVDEQPGIDAERRVDLSDDPTVAPPAGE